jgi:hypothetical protein
MLKWHSLPAGHPVAQVVPNHRNQSKLTGNAWHYNIERWRLALRKWLRKR